MNNISLEYIAGIMVGIISVFVIIAIIVWIDQKVGGKIAVKKKDRKYDERQLLARGVAYKWALFIALIYMNFAAFLYEMEGEPILISFGGIWLGTCITILVFASICIWKDAYVSLNENRRSFVILFGVIGLMNLVVGLINLNDDERQMIKRVPVLIEKEIVEKNVLTFNCMNLITGILFIIILLIFLVKYLYDKKIVDEEDDMEE